MEKSSFLTVGSTVRVRVPTNPKIQRRAVVATLQKDDLSACVLCEQNVGQLPPIAGDAAAAKSHYRLVANMTPLFQEEESESFKDEEELEWTVSQSELTALLPFEATSKLEDSNTAEEQRGSPLSTISAWKEWGDQLLQLGDGAAAIPYYERGLKQSSILQIGGSVVFKQGGHTKVADVDCFDVDEGSVDISMAESGEERTIKEKQVLLCLLQTDDDHVQERLLLNLTRCYLQLADATSSFPASRRPHYLRAAVLATTLVLTIAGFRRHSASDNDETTMSPTHQTALVLRAQAQASLNKLPHALQDVKRLLAANRQHREGRKLLRELEAKLIYQQKKDKHLVKEICQWVQTAAGGEDVSSVPGGNSSGSYSTKGSLSTAGVATRATKDDARPPEYVTWQLLTRSWLTALLVSIAAFLAQRGLQNP
jgi:hypothetical protein